MFPPFLFFHGKLLFRIYPHNRSYGGLCFITISLKTNTHQKNAPSKTIKEYNCLTR